MAVAELITIGNEILDGRVTDTNRAYLGRELKAQGHEVRYAQSVDDNMERVISALELACSRSDLIICTGGLGPTSDDLTAEAVAKFLQCPWEINPEAEKFLRRLFTFRRRDLNASQLKQAKLPTLAHMIANPIGTAPGFFYKGQVSARDVTMYFFPGVPKEMYPMFAASVGQETTAGALRTYTWSTLFTREGDLQELVREAEKIIAPFKLGFRTHLPENHISLMGQVEGDEATERWQYAVELLQPLLSPLSYHEGAEKNYEEIICERLLAKKARVLVVESCTGGLVSNLLTEVPGASQFFWGGQVCYANEEKFRLGVKPEIVAKRGAVSEECALEMAVAGLERLSDDENTQHRFLISLSTTGIAGPGGATDKKPVGLMYMALAVLDVPTSKVKTLVGKLQAPVFLERKAMKLYMAKGALEFLRVNFLTE